MRLHECSADASGQRGWIQAQMTTISGRAWITGISQYVLEDDDPFPEGFTVGDIWP